jgi:hypothetical protein
MTRLRVGNIKIDGTHVEITPVEGSLEPSRQSVPMPVRQESLPGGLDGLKIPAGYLLMAGAVAIFIGAGWLLFSGGPLDIEKYVFHGGLLISAGLSVALLGALKGLKERRARGDAEAKRQARYAGYASKVAGLIQSPSPEQTVAWLSRKVGLTEAEVIHGLAWLREKGRLLEDLHKESGEWFYWVMPQPDDLNSRLKQLQGEENS